MPSWVWGLTLASLSLPAASFLPDADYGFDAFIQDFGRQYQPGSEEYVRRESIFNAQLQSVRVHNTDTSKSWKRGINEFADMSPEEFKSSGRLGYNKALGRHYASLRQASPKLATEAAPASKGPLPARVDWREQMVVTEVKDQGHCGSCWAFGTTETVESYAAINSGKLMVLSPQQLAACAPNPLSCGGKGGCFGSIPEVAYDYVQLYGMTTEWMMPYTAYFGDASKCGFNATRTPSSVHISGYEKLPSNDYDALIQHLAHVGPLAINVDASAWHDYEGGVFDGCNRTNADIDHVVQLVGYGHDATAGDYFLVRNSWDATWGENGYIRLKRESKPTCAVDSSPLDGTGCQGGPATQQVCGTCGMLFDTSYPLGAEVTWKGHHTSIVV